jgi:hypothetical protein
LAAFEINTVMNLKNVYTIHNDSKLVKIVQEASQDETSKGGYKIENGLLFGTKGWFKAIDDGIIPKRIVKGFISRVYTTGHNDYPEFEIESEGEKTTWTLHGAQEAYQVGRLIELIYVELKYKRPNYVTGMISKCIIAISIDY